MRERTIWKILKCHFINQWCIFVWSTDSAVSQKASMPREGVMKNMVRMIKCLKKPYIYLKKKKKAKE